MAFKLYNKEAVKLNTDELIIEAYLDYCAYLAKGKDKRAYVFRKNGVALCTSATLEKIIDTRQDVLSTTHYDASMCDGYGYWVGVCEDSALGRNQKANTATLQMIMRNKYDWDAKSKEDTSESEKNSVDTFKNLLSALPKLAAASKEIEESHTD